MEGFGNMERRGPQHLVAERSLSLTMRDIQTVASMASTVPGGMQSGFDDPRRAVVLKASGTGPSPTTWLEFDIVNCVMQDTVRR